MTTPTSGGRVLGAVPSIPAPQQGIANRIWGDLAQRGANVASEISNTNQNPLLSGIKATGQAFSGIGDVAGEVAKTVAPKTTAAVSGAVQGGFNAVTDALSNTKLIKEAAQYPEQTKVLEDFLSAGGSLGDIANNILLAKGASGALTTATNATGALANTVVGGTLRATGSTLKGAGEAATGVGVGSEVPTRMALQAYEASKPTIFERVGNMVNGTKAETPGIKPTTEANTAVRLLTPGTEWQLGVSANRVASQLWNDTVKPALESSANKTNMRTFLGDLKNQIISETPDLTRRATLLKAWESFNEDYKKVGVVNDAKLQQYKEGWAKFVPEKAYRNEPIAGALNEIRNMAASNARTKLYSSLGPDIQQAYWDYGNLQSIKEAGIKSIDQLRSKGFTKQVWEAIMDKAVTPVATYGGKILYKTGEGLEFIGGTGAKTVRDIFQPDALLTGAGVVAPPQLPPSGTAP